VTPYRPLYVEADPPPSPRPILGGQVYDAMRTALLDVCASHTGHVWFALHPRHAEALLLHCLDVHAKERIRHGDYVGSLFGVKMYADDGARRPKLCHRPHLR